MSTLLCTSHIVSHVKIWISTLDVQTKGFSVPIYVKETPTTACFCPHVTTYCASPAYISKHSHTLRYSVSMENWPHSYSHKSHLEYHMAARHPIEYDLSQNWLLYHCLPAFYGLLHINFMVLIASLMSETFINILAILLPAALIMWDHTWNCEICITCTKVHYHRPSTEDVKHFPTILFHVQANVEEAKSKPWKGLSRE